MSFQLLIHNKMALLENDFNSVVTHVSHVLDNAISSNTSAENLLFNSIEVAQNIKQATSILELKMFKNVTLADQFTATLQVLNNLCNQNNPQSSAKALAILQNIPKKLWQDIPETLNKLLIILQKLIEDFNLDPDYMESIINATTDFAYLFRNHNYVSIGLCNYLITKLKKFLASNSPSNFRAITTFFLDCVRFDLIDKNDKLFIDDIFAFFLLLSNKIQPVERDKMVYEFLSNSLSSPRILTSLTTCSTL